ncbi:hypothetical protein [Noviherbaspirillum pedocola]|uniref:DUF1845 domain-containing protein n=1 Tax=Noviherbaspirillum pedocola TaxID=2801341 RepID=A0A934SUZ8_9BURK|nr:hypothetical protein [Noviherbaspirillum pedocola]MBK4736069.1 hypothetical protein [Noviherbaspirillum pedocola]
MNASVSQFTKTDAEAALAEVREVQQGFASSEDGVVAAVDADVPSAEQVEAFRARAQKQRQRGKRDLERRHSGVASVLKTVVLNERVIGSSFQRYFSSIENGIYVIGRRGEIFVGEAAAAKIVEKIEDMLESISQELVSEEEAIKIQYEVASTATGFVKPDYIGAAAEHEVQIRTRSGLKAVGLFMRYDALLQKVQAMYWNGHIEDTYVQDIELRCKRQFQKLFNFIRSSINGMYRKGTAVKSAAPAGSAAALVSEGAQAEAA